MPETPAPQRPTGRGAQGARDMLLSLAALLVVIFAILGLGRGCSFSPGGPTVDSGAAPTVDEAAQLKGAAAGVDFPVREPALPTGWRANSAATVPVGLGDRSRPAIQIGWLTAGGAYLRLSQSQADAADLAKSETEGTTAPSATGTVEVKGVRWTVYPARRQERSWLTERDGVRLLISGSAQEAEFRVLAEATQTAPLVARG
ncbi:DUF4245 domain-containing protein [Kutzneria albida]|nr:DUF4245 domain-containing protein [Kutzneria albida]